MANGEFIFDTSSSRGSPRREPGIVFRPAPSEKIPDRGCAASGMTRAAHAALRSSARP